MSYTSPPTESEIDSYNKNSEEEEGEDEDISFADMVRESSERTNLDDLYAQCDDL